LQQAGHRRQFNYKRDKRVFGFGLDSNKTLGDYWMQCAYRIGSVVRCGLDSEGYCG